MGIADLREIFAFDAPSVVVDVDLRGLILLGEFEPHGGPSSRDSIALRITLTSACSISIALTLTGQD